MSRTNTIKIFLHFTQVRSTFGTNKQIFSSIIYVHRERGCSEFGYEPHVECKDSWWKPDILRQQNLILTQSVMEAIMLRGLLSSTRGFSDLFKFSEHPHKTDEFRQA
jgi:hypothetical protein